MKTTRWALPALMAIALLGGCASSGNRVLKDETDSSIKERILVGQSTKTDVKADFGAPMRVSYTDGGNEIWSYDYRRVNFSLLDFVPVVNAITRSASGTQKELVVLFDKSDTVQRVSLTESKVEDKAGLIP